MSLKLFIIAVLLAMAFAGNPHINKGGYGRPQYIRAPIPVYNYGPDNARYRLTANLYDNYVYQRTHLNVDRFPGGVDYNHNLDGYGANVKVHFKSYPSRVNYGNKGRGY